MELESERRRNMIFDSISNKENYKEEKEIYQTLNFLEKLKKWDDVESNAIIQKDWISANPVSFLSKDESECMYEAHRKHIDVHYIMEGIEKIATADVKNLQEKVPFDKDKDIGFYEGCESGSYLLKTGDFMVCFPSDAHKVGMMNTVPGMVKKVVVKIREMSEMSVIDNIRLTFLYIEFYSMGKTWVYPESYIPYNIFRYIVKGKAEFCIDGEEIIVKENQIVYIPQGCRMSCRALSESFEFYSLRFTTSVFYEGEDVLKEYYGIPRIIENEGEDYYFKEICKWVKKDSWVKKCFVRGYLDLLIGTLSMRVNKFDKNTGKVTEKNENPVLKIAKRKEQIDSRVQLVADYVVLHPREKYTPQKMAEMVELSKQRFSSLFKANMGKSPMEYVREIRLTTAARALLVSNKNINDIAYECGYEDANYFIREFKSAFGFTPNQYRKIARE